MDTLLFLDYTTPRPYDPANLDGPGIGGTEHTMVSLAEALGKLKIVNVVVEQHNRYEDETYVSQATYTSIGVTKKARWVVVLRDPRAIRLAWKRFPDAKIYLFSHDLASQDLGNSFQRGDFEHCEANICVSHWHKTQSIEVLKQFGYSGQFRHRVLYNPIDVDYLPTVYNKNKLIWMASPHKGLDRAYELFNQLLKLNSEFKLYVTNPGYLEDYYAKDSTIKNSVVVLGTLPHSDVINHLRDSLCLFYPNTVFPETFGKVMAEANAAAVPVLTHPLGASREVLDSHPDQVIDCRDNETVLRRVMKWYNGARPVVRGNTKFKITAVISEWRKLLDIR